MELRRRDVILAFLGVFIAWGFATQWAPSLRSIPHAFLAGVVSTIALYLWAITSTSREPGDLEYSRSYGKRAVAFISTDVWGVEVGALRARLSYKRKPLYPPSFVISDKIDDLINLIIRDYVTVWYANISKRTTFSNEVDRVIRVSLDNLIGRLATTDIIEAVTLRIVPLITDHLREFYDAERAVRGRKLSRNVTESEELDLAIARKYKDGKLHPAASLAYSNMRLVQQQYLRSTTTRLLPKVLPPNMITSPSVNVITRELITCAVLFPIAQLLSDPDTWNQLVEAYGRTMLQERKTIRKLRAALDEHAPSSPLSTRNTHFPKLLPRDNERKFERFIRAIKQCTSLSDARRFRSEVASQLRRDVEIEGQDIVYIRRLETGKRLLDQKVAMLGAGGSMKKEKIAFPVAKGHKKSASRLEQATLKEVLHDAAGLSYFMEFMDRKGLMRQVQFWIVVDGIRNPLEGDQDEIDESSAMLTPWSNSERADLAQINDAYLSKPELENVIGVCEAVNEFLRAGSAATPSQYHAARSALLQAQTAVYREMQGVYFPRFRKSDLYFKYLASDEVSQAAALPHNPNLHEIDFSPSTHSPRPVKAPRALSAKTIPQRLDLQRSIASSSDLKRTRKTSNEPPTRRSLDTPSTRTPLFDDDYDSDPLARSTQSLDSSDVEGSKRDVDEINVDDSQIVDAMQAALNDIMEAGHEKDSLHSDTNWGSAEENDSLRGSFEAARPLSPGPLREKKEKPSLSSLGLVGAPSRLGVFNDDLFGEEEKFLEDEVEDLEANEKSTEDEIHEAAPGDLGLTEAIDVLTQDIEKLVAQESIVDTLTRKAELTNNAAELRILRKSKMSLQREIHRKELQRQQYIVQESDNSLYGRATVSIQSIMVGNGDDGREFATYVIEVRRRAGEQMPAAAWVIARRYSEFHDLNKRLRAKYAQTRNLDFPRRQMVLKLQKDFLQKRRIALERYIRELLLIPSVCRSRELRAFLSQHAISSVSNAASPTDNRDFVTRIYSSVTDGMEEFLGNIPVLDQLSVAGQNLISAATSQLAQNPSLSSVSPALVSDDPVSAAEAEAELQAFENKELEPFVKPICDLFLETFELNRENNWLRGRAVIVVLHQLLGGTIERKIRDNAKAFTQENTMAGYFDFIKNVMWPDGKLRQSTSRTSAEKARSKDEAALVLATLVPELVGTVVGRNNAQGASRRIAATLNNQRLNTHLVFTVFDEILHILFGDLLVR